MDVMTPGFLRRIVAPSIHKTALELVDLWCTKSVLAGDKCFAVQHDLKIAAFDTIWTPMLGSESGGMRAEMEMIASEDVVPSHQSGSVVLPSAPLSKLYESIVYLNHTINTIMGSPSPVWHHWFIRQTAKFKRHNATKNQEMKTVMEEAGRRFQDNLEKEEIGEEHDTCALDLVLRRQLANNKNSHHSKVGQNAELEDELTLMLVAVSINSIIRVREESGPLTYNRPTRQRPPLLAGLSNSSPTTSNNKISFENVSRTLSHLLILADLLVRIL